MKEINNETNIVSDDILGNNVSSNINNVNPQSDDVILGACTFKDSILCKTNNFVCVESDTACPRDLDICTLDSCPSDEAGCGTSDWCETNYVYYNCSTDTEVATRSWFNSYTHTSTKFTDGNRILIRQDPGDIIGCEGWNIKGNYNNNQAVLKRDVGYRSY